MPEPTGIPNTRYGVGADVALPLPPKALIQHADHLIEILDQYSREDAIKLLRMVCVLYGTY